MPKLFGFFKARGEQRARLVRVDATGQMSREDLRRKLTAISARKSRLHMQVHTARQMPKNDQPPSPIRAGRNLRPAVAA